MNKKPVDLLIISAVCYPSTDIYRFDTTIRSLGPHKIAHTVKKHGYSCMVITRTDRMSEAELESMCECFVDEGTIIGVSTTFMYTTVSKAGKVKDHTETHPYIEMLCRMIKKFQSQYNNKVLIGGPNALWWKKTFDTEYAIVGFADNEVVSFLNSVKNNGLSKNKADPWTIQTCDFRWTKNDFIVPKEVLPLEISRGCIFTCKFCTYENLGKKKGTYERDMNLVKEELLYNYEEFGTQSYVITSDTFNDSDERMNEWCDMLETLPFSIKYVSYARLELLYKYPKTARRLYESGLVGSQFGIETFHPEASKAVGKSFNATKSKEFIVHLYNDIFERNFIMFGSYIIGLPGETEEFAETTMDWINKNPWFSMKFNPLHLTNNKIINKNDLESIGQVANSEFSKDPEIHGYRFPRADDPFYWESDVMDFSKAGQIAVRFNRALSHTTVSSWGFINYHSVFNVPVSPVANKQYNFKQLHKGDLERHYFDGYKRLLHEYVNQ